MNPPMAPTAVRKGPILSGDAGAEVDLKSEPSFSQARVLEAELNAITSKG